MKISKLESCLLLALLIIPIGGIIYYTKNWNYIPAFISAKSNKYKEVDKTTYAMFCIGMLSVPLGIGLYITSKDSGLRRNKSQPSGINQCLTKKF
jgi:hypothetical protein